jgi:hydrogenase expression/formation protein HypD
MEVCGTHTAAIWSSGLRSFMSEKIRLISGPGCPVCVTPSAYIDRCIEYAEKDNHTLISFGDMLKVPGTKTSLSGAKADGANVKMVYSPFETIKLAEENPQQTFIVAAVGFETTVPAYAMLIEELIKKEIKNVKLLTALKSATAAIEWICENEKEIDGFLCPGHVAVITGETPFKQIAQKYNKPTVIAGFGEQHILTAVYDLTRHCERSEAIQSLSKNDYEAVTQEGNKAAKEAITKYFTKTETFWRGLGTIKNSGYTLKKEYAAYNAGEVNPKEETLPKGCRCGEVIRGRIDPPECKAFAKTCTPEHPLGPCMVSSEGACGIWQRNLT